MAGRIGIIDYGMGNLRSVQKAFESVGGEAVILASAEATHWDTLDRLVLPGVGAFADGMANLTAGGWVDPIRRFIDSGRPFLGICLGLQLLFEGSQEDAVDGRPVPGLGILAGQVVSFVPQNVPGKPRLKVPHMGWNVITWQRPDPLFAGLASEVGGGKGGGEGGGADSNNAFHAIPVGRGCHEGTDSGGGAGVYFVHGYYAQPTQWADVSATSDYGIKFCASIWRKNIWATQFHPEKSQAVGLKMLANFISIP